MPFTGGANGNRAPVLASTAARFERVAPPTPVIEPPTNIVVPWRASVVTKPATSGFQPRNAAVVASTAARLLRAGALLGPMCVNEPPTYTVDPVTTSANTSPVIPPGFQLAIAWVAKSKRDSDTPPRNSEL